MYEVGGGWDDEDTELGAGAGAGTRAGAGAGAGADAGVGAGTEPGTEPTTDRAAALQSGGTTSPGRTTPSILGLDPELVLDTELEIAEGALVAERLDDTVEGAGSRLGGFFLLT